MGAALVLDYKSCSLRYFLDQNKATKMTEKHLIKLLYSLLCSLQFLQSANIMHRDIKPANLLVNHDSTISLCDFGFSRTVPEQVTIEGESRCAKKDALD